jgi:hypothetical protein
MPREDFIKHIKKLLKIYHPDLCPDENLKNTYNEITIKLNSSLNKLEKKEIDIKENLIENKYFDIFSFRYYFSKIQSIGINKNSTKNKDFIIFRNFLITEINKNSNKIGEYFSLLLSDDNIKNETINIFTNGYANYNSIFQNYYQYKVQTVKSCILIGNSYFNDYVKVSEIKGINRLV